MHLICCCVISQYKVQSENKYFILLCNHTRIHAGFPTYLIIFLQHVFKFYLYMEHLIDCLLCHVPIAFLCLKWLNNFNYDKHLLNIRFKFDELNKIFVQMSIFDNFSFYQNENPSTIFMASSSNLGQSNWMVAVTLEPSTSVVEFIVEFIIFVEVRWQFSGRNF